MKRQNIEFRWGWFDALRRRDDQVDGRAARSRHRLAGRPPVSIAR